MNKYRNIKTTYYGHTFDSKKEAERYLVLRDMEKRGEIKDLVLQPRYVLQLGFTDRYGVKHRPIEYVADFGYKQASQGITEDVKGMLTDVYKIKKKLFLYSYPEIEFREI